MGPHVKFPNGAASPHVTYPPIPPATAGHAGGVIRHRSTFAIPLSASDEPISKWDRLKGNGRGPQTVPAPPAAPDTGGLPYEWFPRRDTRAITHD